MRLTSVVKVVILAAAVALPVSFSAAEAKTMKLPPGACAIGKKGVLASSMVCSYGCDPKTMMCMQQLCINGVLNQVGLCFSPFCSPKCGG